MTPESKKAAIKRLIEFGDSEPTSRSPLSNRHIAEILQALLNERDALRAFADDILEHQGGSLDGCDIQEYGVKHGLLVKFTATEPCGEDCACAEVGLPTECYRRAAVAASEPSTPK